MGLGKTIQAIGALRVLARAGRLMPALVVAPASLVLQWRAELQAWAPELRLATARGSAEERRAAWRAEADVTIVGYESLIADMRGRFPGAPRHRAWGVVIADEAQRLKNPKTETNRTLASLRRNQTWALTGTPLENELADLVTILEFVAPGRYDRKTMLVGLRRATAELQVRRRRAAVLPTLPAKTRFVIDPGMTPAQRDAYDIAEREGRVWLRAFGAEIRIEYVLELILRLKQICNAHPRTGASAKLDDLARRVGEIVATGDKVLVFSQFVAAPFGVDAVAERLRAFRPLTVVGGQDAAARAMMIDRFNTDPARRVLVLSLKAGGVGLNLVAATTVFHFDHWWNQAATAQAEDRAHRIGQQRAVQVFSYLCGDTIEDRIAAIIARKQALFDTYVDGIDLPDLRRLGLADLLEAVGV